MGDSITTNPPEIELKLFSQPRLLAPARALVGSFANRLGFNEIQCGQISLAIDEAICNIINHGYDRRPDGEIQIRIWALGDNPGGNDDAAGLHIVIEDRARQVDPEKIRSRDLDDVRPGGLGVYIIQEIMDEVQYEHRSGGGMSLSMTKRVPACDESASAGSAARGGEGKHA
ncbi:MAG: ATP-binding protein [Planctomycetota bacterium]|jgi:anti-sigma regulatory factor (Ser/Thr protein kinase)